MRVPSLIGALVSLGMFACATAVIPSDPGDLVGGGDGGKGGDGSPYGGGDDGGSSTDTGTEDTGTTTQPDTGTPVVDSGTPVVDSGGGALHGGDCTRTTSTQFTPAETYDTVCDNHYNDTFSSASCTLGDNSCARYNGQAGFTTFCCYQPPAGSNCDYDYFGGAQCVPE